MRRDPYRLRRYHLSLTSFAGIVFNASHWWCRLYWTDEDGEDHEADAEHGRGDDREMRFADKASARAAGLRLARRLAEKDGVRYYVVTEGHHAVIDPQRCLSAPGNLKTRLNQLWRAFEKKGWDVPKAEYPKVQAVCDDWTRLIGERR